MIGMGKKPIQLSEEEIRHIEMLRQRPELRERFEAILAISHVEGEVRSADEVEELLIEEVRKLGNASMKQWAKEAEARVGQQHQEKTPGSYSGKKTAELVVRLWESGSRGADMAEFPAELPEGILRADRGFRAREKPCAQTSLE